jgi:peptide/nickel transport system substrate-binding protein
VTRRSTILLLLAVLAVVSPQAVAQGSKTLIVAQAGDIDTLDNEKALGPSKNATIQCVDWQWLGYQVKTLPDGIKTVDMSKFVPRVLERWEDKVLPDGRAQYTGYLRKGIKHHNGNEVTAEDLRFNVLRRAAFKRDSLEVNLAGVTAETVKAVDRHTIQFNVPRPSRYFWHVWAQRTFYDSKFITEKAPGDQWGEEYLKKNCPASGPYKIVRWTPGVEMVMERNANWWGKAIGEEPKLDRIVFRTVPSVETRTLLLSKGEVDMAFDLPIQEIRNLRNARGVKILSIPSANMLFVGMNPKVKPFDNVDVRRALSYAFPYKEAIDKVYSGGARRLNGPLAAEVKGARRAAAYFTDLNRAKTLLAEAGYPNGFEAPLTYNAAFQAHEDLAVLFKSNLEKIGVRVNLQKMQSGQFASETREKRVAFFFYEVLWWIRDPQYFLDFSFDSTTYLNLTAYANADVDKLLQQLRTTADEKARDRIVGSIQNLIINDVPWIFVAQPNFNMAMRSNIDGYIAQNTELHHLWLVDKK